MINSDPHVIGTKAGRCFDRRKLADGEVTSDTVTTIMLSTSMRFYWRGWSAKAAMADDGALAMTRLGELGYGFRVTQ